MPITMMFAADILGAKYGRYVRDYNILADAQIKTAEMFGLDYVSTISCPTREATDYGAKIQWYEDQPPAVLEEEVLFMDKRTLAGFQISDPLSGGRREDRIRGIELLRQRVGAMKTTIDVLQAVGLRMRVKVLIGGAPVTGQYAKEIGADGYSENASGAVSLMRQIVAGA